MKTKLTLAKAIGCAAVALSGSASAALYMPPADEPIYIKFNNKEQICSDGSNCITPPGGADDSTIALPTGVLGRAEQNWGILKVSSISLGKITPADPYLYGTAGDNIFSTSFAGQGQITGIFYGLQATNSPNYSISSTSGYLDFWFDQSGLAGGGTDADLADALPSGRTASNEFANFTDGIFLGRIAYAPGIDATGDPNVTIIGDATPSEVGGGFTGVADSYGDVVDVTGDGVIDAADGAWASLMNGDYFPVLIDHDLDPLTALVPEERDFRFKNSYNHLEDWDGVGSDNTTPIIGANSDDPGRVFTASTVPEPGSLALMGLGLIGAGLASRRRK